MRRALAAAAWALLPALAAAQSVSMSGSLGNKALLMIDGQPRTVAAGASVGGVKVIRVTGSETVVEVGGQRQTLPLGGAQVNLGGVARAGSGTEIRLAAGPGGHFVTSGTINGRAVRFLVDTGATHIALSEAVARGIGLDYTRGERGLVNTANGQAVAHRLLLNEVRVGDVVVYDVTAMVVPAPMDMVLLGNSFLTRFQMRRDADIMVLEKRY